MKGMTSSSSVFTAPGAVDSNSISIGICTLKSCSSKFLELFDNSRRDRFNCGSFWKIPDRFSGWTDRRRAHGECRIRSIAREQSGRFDGHGNA